MKMRLHWTGCVLATAYAVSGVLIHLGMQIFPMLREFRRPLPLLSRAALQLTPTGWLVVFIVVACAIVVKDAVRPIVRTWPYIATLGLVCVILLAAIFLPVMVIADPVLAK